MDSFGLDSTVLTEGTFVIQLGETLLLLLLIIVVIIIIIINEAL